MVVLVVWWWYSVVYNYALHAMCIYIYSVCSNIYVLGLSTSCSKCCLYIMPINISYYASALAYFAYLLLSSKTKTIISIGKAYIYIYNDTHAQSCIITTFMHQINKQIHK